MPPTLLVCGNEPDGQGTQHGTCHHGRARNHWTLPSATGKDPRARFTPPSTGGYTLPSVTHEQGEGQGHDGQHHQGGPVRAAVVAPEPPRLGAVAGQLLQGE